MHVLAKHLAWIAALVVMALLPVASARAEVVAADHRSRQLDQLFAYLDDGKRPGAAVMVIQSGKVVYRAGFGYAELEQAVQITPQSTFRLGSVSKQFTAMAIMVLQEQGKLDYDDAISKYLPRQKVYPGVTIRHLLTHTSGLPDYYDEIEHSDRLLTNREIGGYLAQMNSPRFTPGARYEYSNSAYELLALIVEQAAGMRFADFMQQQVFQPAGMTGALVFDHTEPPMSNRVYGYDSARQGYTPNDAHFLNGIVGSGGVYATLHDFYAWEHALHNNLLVTAATRHKAFTRATLNDGSSIDYGFGWRLDHYRGFERITHGGSWVGFRTSIARFPAQQLAIVVLSNVSDFAAENAVDRVADIYLPQQVAEFRPSSSVHMVQRQLRRLPTDRIWWEVTGTDQAWNFKNLHQLFPTVNVYRNGPVRELAYQANPAIGDYEVDTPGGKMRFDDFIQTDQSTLMGIVVLHKGQIAYERYPRMQEHEMPVYWSVAKAFVGTVVRILEERGQIDVSEAMDYYLPQLGASDFAGIPVRDVLDMATGLDCADDYTDQQSCYYRYSAAIGDGFRVADSPDNPYDFLRDLQGTQRHAPAGQQFSYSGLNTFALAWLVEEVTGMPFQDVFSSETWYHIGAESNASYIAPRYGAALALA